MRLILGLGNPGTKYEHSRHNVGFEVVDMCAAFFQVTLKKRCFRLYRQAKVGDDVLLVQPLTYMNASGKVLKHFPGTDASDMIVICDQLDLPAGMIRIRKGGSSAGHNGLKSLIEHLGNSDFIRIYVGIGRPEEGVSVIEHVLGRIEDEKIVNGIRLASQALIELVEGRALQEVMVAYNRRSRVGKG